MPNAIDIGQIWEIWLEMEVEIGKWEEHSYWYKIEEIYIGDDGYLWSAGSSSDNDWDNVVWGNPTNAYWENKRKRIA